MRTNHFIEAIKRSCNKDEYKRNFGCHYEQAVLNHDWDTVARCIEQSSWAKRYTLTSQRLLSDINKIKQ